MSEINNSGASFLRGKAAGSGAINDGGPAFPGETWGSKGMSLRDYFAARASENDIGFHYNLIYEKSSYRTSPTREQARYAYADAMLAERQKERE